MAHESWREEVAAAMRRINQAWLDGKVEGLSAALGPMLHPEVVMVYPGFAMNAQGREIVLAGFIDFVQNAVVREFRESDQHVDVAGNTAVVTFRFEMVYEREGRCYRSTGRDLWVFHREAGAWLAVWRTMLDMDEKPEPRPAAPA